MFRGLLILMAIVLTVYTIAVAQNHGLALYPVFFGDMAKMGWPGQFNLDFMFMLTLSGLWVAWRHGFSLGGLILGLIAFNGGASFLTLYLLVVSIQEKGEMKAILLGRERAAG